MRRRRYRDDPYYQGRRSYRRGGGGDSCARDACMLETGCCVAEALDGSCLMAGLMLLPRMFTMTSGRSDRTIDLIRLYQRQISAKRTEPVCRFSPSCSNYAIDAITTHGTVRGMVLAGRRLARCRPGGMRGADPVPA